MAQHDFAPAWLSFPTPPPSTAKLPPAPERPGDHVSRPDGRAGSSRRRHNSSDAFLDAGFGRNPDVRTRPISRQNSLETEPVRGTGNHGNRRPPGRLHSDTGASRGSYHWEGGGGQRGGPYHDGDGRGGGGGGGGGGGAHRGSYHADGGGGGGGQRGGPYHPDSDAPPRRGYRDRDRDGGHRSRNGAFHGGGHKGRRGGGMEDGGPGGGMEDGARRGDDKADEKQFEVEDFPSLNPDADRDPGQGKPASVPAGVWENPPNPRPRSTKMLVIKKSCREESFSAAFASTLAPPCAGASAITPLQLCSPSSSSSSSSSASSGAGAARAAHHHQHHQHHPASAHNGVAAVAPVSGGAAAPVVAVVPGGGVGGGGGGSGAVVGPGVGAALPPAIIGVAAGVSGGGAVGVGKPGSGGAGGGAAGVGSSSIYKILVPKPAALPAKPSLWKSPGSAKDARSSGSFTRDSAFRLYSPFSPKPAPPPPVPVPSVVSVAPAHNHHKESAAVATPATVASAAPPVTAATAPASPGSAAVPPSATVVSAVVAASALRPASTSPVEAGGSAAMAPRLTKLGRARNNGKSEFLKTLKREARNGEPAGRPHGSGTGGGANTNAGHGQQDENRRSSSGGSSSSSNNGGGNGGNNNNGGMRLEEAESPVGSGGPMASDWPEHQGQRSPEASSPSPDDHMLSSSLEAEHRLLREMGWTELCEQDEAYEPLTEDEMKEFQRISEKLQSNGLRRNGLLKHAPATIAVTTSSTSSSSSSSSSSSFSSTATVTKVAAATPGSAAAPSPGFRFPSWGAALLGQPELLAVAHGDAHLLHDDGDDDSTSTSDTSDDDDL